MSMHWHKQNYSSFTATVVFHSLCCFSDNEFQTEKGRQFADGKQEFNISILLILNNEYDHNFLWDDLPRH